MAANDLNREGKKLDFPHSHTTKNYLNRTVGNDLVKLRYNDPSVSTSLLMHSLHRQKKN